MGKPENGFPAHLIFEKETLQNQEDGGNGKKRYWVVFLLLYAALRFSGGKQRAWEEEKGKQAGWCLFPFGGADHAAVPRAVSSELSGAEGAVAWAAYFSG